MLFINLTKETKVMNHFSEQQISQSTSVEEQVGTGRALNRLEMILFL